MTFQIYGADVEISSFPAGEKKIVVKEVWNDEINKDKVIRIVFKWSKDNGDIFTLALLVDAIRRFAPDYTLLLSLPYIPYQQQDRVANLGEGLSIRVFAEFINSLKFDRVEVMDAHSYVATALLDNVYEYEMADCFYQVVPTYKLAAGYIKDFVLVAPDAGAMKKVEKIASRPLKKYDMISATKVRNTVTGELSDFRVNSTEHIGKRDFMICDDLAIAGGTFIGLAKELRKLTDGKIYLYVTHGIFSKGYDELAKHIDGIYVRNLIGEKNPLIVKYYS